MSLRLGIALLRRLLERRHAALELGAEVADQALDRPRGGVAERADRVAFHFLSHFLEEIDLLGARIALLHAGEHAPHPARALAAGRALAAALMLVEIGKTLDRLHDVGRLVRSEER